jgi:nucleoside-triphosphatase THEP1
MQTKESNNTKRVHNLIIVDESGSMEVIRKQAL